MTSNFRKHFIDNAIDGWENIDKNELANLCIEHENDPSYDKYVSALISKYLYKNITLKTRFGGYLDDEELNDRIVDGVLRALEYRSWLRKGTSVYGDPNGPDKTINRCIKTQCQVYKRLNFGTEGKNPAYKRKIRYFTDSLDNFQEDYGDYYYNLIDEKNHKENNLDFLIEKYINKDLIDAIILDTICYQDSIKEDPESKKLVYDDGSTEKVKISHLKFDRHKVIKNISNMNDNYMKYFSEKYMVDVTKLYNINEVILNSTKSNNNFLYRKLDKLLNSLRENKELLESIN